MFEEKIKNLESQISMEEKQYKSEISRENDLISKLNDELSILTLQLKEKEQEIRINELKLKELKRMSKHNQLAPLKNTNTDTPTQNIPANRSTSAKHNANNTNQVNPVKKSSQKYQSNENLPANKVVKKPGVNRIEKKKTKDDAIKEGIQQDIENKEKLLAELIKLKNETQMESQPEKTDEIQEQTEI